MQSQALLDLLFDPDSDMANQQEPITTAVARQESTAAANDVANADTQPAAKSGVPNTPVGVPKPAESKAPPAGGWGLGGPVMPPPPVDLQDIKSMLKNMMHKMEGFEAKLAASESQSQSACARISYADSYGAPEHH
jgi:hypothetical protein